MPKQTHADLDLVIDAVHLFCSCYQFHVKSIGGIASGASAVALRSELSKDPNYPGISKSILVLLPRCNELAIELQSGSRNEAISAQLDRLMAKLSFVSHALEVACSVVKCLESIPGTGPTQDQMEELNAPILLLDRLQPQSQSASSSSSDAPVDEFEALANRTK